jgi:hypothetical protein
MQGGADVRIPTFSRRSDTDTAADEHPTAATTPVRARKEGSTVARPDDETTTRFTTAGAPADRRDHRFEHAEDRTDARFENTEARQDRPFADADRSATTREQQRMHDEPVVTGPKPRASLLATLGLILAIASALLVLSGPLLGYGIGVAGLALILSLAGLRATKHRHIAGKTDALIGTIVSLAAIVVGVLALTGSLYWLGTDMQPVNSLRDWLDAQVVDRF